MLDFSNLRFEQWPENGTTRIRAGFKLSAETVAPHDITIGYELAKEELRRMLNRKVYGELRQPIAELIDLALRSPDFETVERVHKLRSEILELLSLKK